jgi:hypothetical protein
MRRVLGLCSGIVVLAACGREPIATENAATAQAAAASESFGADVNQDLAALRRVTASFHDFETAKAAGWKAEITGCMTDPVAGGMGFHYGNTKLIDGTARVEEPELLLYEPEKNGQLRLVAVEYIIPLSAWTSPNPPRLFGRDFKVNAAFQIWGLHAWVWEDNPSGMFADWNPRVNCDNTTDIAAMVQH